MASRFRPKLWEKERDGVGVERCGERKRERNVNKERERDVERERERESPPNNLSSCVAATRLMDLSPC